LGGIGGILVSRFVPLPAPLRAASPLVAPAIGGLAGAGIGHLALQQAETALSSALLKRQARWLLRGETMLIAQGAISGLSGIVEIIRDTDNPALFIIREGISETSGEVEEQAIELHNAEQLREAARKLARGQKKVQMPDSDWRSNWRKTAFAAHRQMISRVRDNEQIILAANGYLSFAARLGTPISIAGEWLLDNGYVIEGQIKDARKNLSPQFYANLPVLSDETQNLYAGMPRVYALAVELVRRTDARLDKANISEWVDAYQSATPLTTGELWACP
jgi:cyclic beta-1,2-glucan synthetase